jgi:hypothetical protein
MWLVDDGGGGFFIKSLHMTPKKQRKKTTREKGRDQEREVWSATSKDLKKPMRIIRSSIDSQKA